MNRSAATLLAISVTLVGCTEPRNDPEEESTPPLGTIHNYTVTQAGRWTAEAWTDCSALPNGSFVNVGIRLTSNVELPDKTIPVMVQFKLTSRDRTNDISTFEYAATLLRVDRKNRTVEALTGQGLGRITLQPGVGWEAILEDVLRTYGRNPNHRYMELGEYDLETEIRVDGQAIKIRKMPIKFKIIMQ